jgi:hypothetical protein
VQHLAARRQHSYTGALRKEGGSHSRRLLESVLTRVEHEDRLGMTKMCDQARERVGAASVKCLGDQSDDSRRPTGVRKLDQPHPI